MERRILFQPIELETREGESSGVGTLSGHAAVFDSLSEDLGGFRERILPGAFDPVLKSNPDVRALANHNPNLLLGRTTSGTLKLSLDKRGLRYEVDLPNTSTGRDIAESVRRGDMTGSSFAFFVDEDEFSEDDDGAITRTIKSFRSLLDVGPVTYPAYHDADVAKRCLDDWKRAAWCAGRRRRALEHREREFHLTRFAAVR